MKRREFILALGGVVAAIPVASAQQATMPTIGFLDSGFAKGMDAYLDGFRRGLKETGYAEGENVAIVFRWSEGRMDQLKTFAAELAARPVDVIVGSRGPAPGLAAKAATSTIPVVFQTGSDPVEIGLVASMNRPGGNVTGVTRMSTALIPKRLGVLRELVPGMSKLALLVNPNGPQTAEQIRDMQEPTRALGLQLHIVEAGNESELEATFAEARKVNAQALIVASDNLFIGARGRVVEQAAQHALPTIYFEPESVRAGGLMCYSASLADSFRQAGVYAGRILRGAKPAELPVLQPDKFELILNLKTAKALGLTVPPTLLATADEVIE
ncbi:putative ABC transport system substrate-binding protein [Bradyrhizobium erythrophlei]|nr:putative ABC transport system substrate-binding protein [Bradyrhizobium erythrophlei]